MKIIEPNIHRLFMTRTSNIYHNQLRRARSGNAQLDYTLDDLRLWVREALDTEGCAYCQQPLLVTSFSIDHCQPLSRGGVYTQGNLVICCNHCNQVKGSLGHLEYQALLKLVHTWDAQVRKDFMARLKAGGKFIRR